jgi:hypothetical protein
MIYAKINAAAAAVRMGAEVTVTIPVIVHVMRLIVDIPVKAVAIKHVLKPVARLAPFAARNAPEGIADKTARPRAEQLALRPAAKPAWGTAVRPVLRLAAKPAWKTAARPAWITAERLVLRVAVYRAAEIAAMAAIVFVVITAARAAA